LGLSAPIIAGQIDPRYFELHLNLAAFGLDPEKSGSFKGEPLNLMNNWLNKTRIFINETIAELKRCTWPSRDELYESTVLVIVTVLLLALFVTAVDAVSGLAIDWLTTM
jgi:preprotein translocase subunit SecE